MNSESLPNNSHPKKDYQKLSKTLKKRCEEVSQDNDALSSRLIKLKLLIYKAENQSRKLQTRLESHGVDYQAAASAAVHAESNELFSEKTEVVASTPSKPSRPKHTRKKRTKPPASAAPPTNSTTLHELANSADLPLNPC